jgi:Fe-S oxidoreductase
MGKHFRFGRAHLTGKLLDVGQHYLLVPQRNGAFATHLRGRVSRQPFDWPTFAADVIVQGRCHQKALLGMQGDSVLLNKLGVKWKLLDAGCCGMAGSFGFNAEHHALSLKIGEDKLFPAVREATAANAETIVLTNGFSCREQIEQGTGRHAMHIAQLAQRALARR